MAGNDRAHCDRDNFDNLKGSALINSKMTKSQNREALASLRVRIGITTRNRPEYRAYDAGTRYEARGQRIRRGNWSRVKSGW